MYLTEAAVLFPQYLPRIARLSPTRYRPTPRPAQLCPECAGPLARASGCVTCPACGWGKCG